MLALSFRLADSDIFLNPYTGGWLAGSLAFFFNPQGFPPFSGRRRFSDRANILADLQTPPERLHLYL
jgi:hypothetical protein